MKKMSLNFKMACVITLLVISSSTIAGLGINKMAGLNDSLNSIANVEAVRVILAEQLRNVFSIQTINEKNFILEESKEGMNEMKKRLDNRHEEVAKRIEEMQKILSERDQKDLEDFKETYATWWQTSTQIQNLSLAGDNKAAFEISKTKGREIRIKGEEIIERLVNKNQKSMKEASIHAEAEYSKARFLMITISLVAIMSSIAIAGIVMRSLGRSIDQVISSLTDNSNQVTSAAQQIASSSEELSQAATEQASSLEETASSVEELNSMIQKNADNARATSEVALSTKDTSNKGKEVMIEMIGAMDDIKSSNTSIMEQINDSNQRISEIVKVIAEIGNKTKVINDIVFQTKLLSFNASVEAARAGEHGKGFAVVAEEVGNLAQMSGNAAKEISSMLEESIQKVEGIVNETKQKVEHLILDGKHKVESGTRIAKQCGDVLEEIVKNVSNVTQMANEISTACQEQAQGVQEITKAMNQLDQVTQTNAATSEEAASAAEELSAQAESLQSVVGILVVTVKGGTGDNAVTAAAIAAAPAVSAKATHKMANKESAKVLALNTKKTTEVSGFPLKKAAGYGLSSVPSENDPRFEEV